MIIDVLDTDKRMTYECDSPYKLLKGDKIRHIRVNYIVARAGEVFIFISEDGKMTRRTSKWVRDTLEPDEVWEKYLDLGFSQAEVAHDLGCEPYQVCAVNKYKKEKLPLKTGFKVKPTKEPVIVHTPARALAQGKW